MPPPCKCGQTPCQCGEGPQWGWWGNRLRDCWKELEWLRQFIRDTVLEGVPGKSFPIPGDTTGKVAAAGIVGEYLTNTVSGAFTAALQIQSVAALIVSPGDWDCQAEVSFNGVAPATLDLTGALMELSPVPPGVSGTAYAADSRTATGLAAGTIVAADTNGWVSLTGPRFQACVSAPTLLAFQLATNITAAGNAGIFTFITTARRMR
jgi:hypothetical protein